jgi:hypothetical protein
MFQIRVSKIELHICKMQFEYENDNYALKIISHENNEKLQHNFEPIHKVITPDKIVLQNMKRLEYELCYFSLGEITSRRRSQCHRYIDYRINRQIYVYEYVGPYGAGIVKIKTKIGFYDMDFPYGPGELFQGLFDFRHLLKRKIYINGEHEFLLRGTFNIGDGEITYKKKKIYKCEMKSDRIDIYI